MQSKGKKRKGASMSSKEKITKSDASEDALLTESAYFDRTIPQMPVEGTKMNKERRWSFQKNQRWERR